MALVFVSGAVLGGLGYRAYYSSSANAQRRPTPEEWRKINLAEMHNRLKLDDQQFAKLGQIFDRSYAEVHQVMDKRHKEDLASPPGSMLDRIKHAVADDRARMGLTEQQVTGVDQLIDRVQDDFRQKMAKRHAEEQALQDSLVERIDAILQPDQRDLYKQLRDERQKQQERRQLDDAKQGRGPGRPPMQPPPPPSAKK